MRHAMNNAPTARKSFANENQNPNVFMTEGFRFDYSPLEQREQKVYIGARSRKFFLQTEDGWFRDIESISRRDSTQSSVIPSWVGASGRMSGVSNRNSLAPDKKNAIIEEPPVMRPSQILSQYNIEEKIKQEKELKSSNEKKEEFLTESVKKEINLQTSQLIHDVALLSISENNRSSPQIVKVDIEEPIPQNESLCSMIQQLGQMGYQTPSKFSEFSGVFSRSKVNFTINSDMQVVQNQVRDMHPPQYTLQELNGFTLDDGLNRFRQKILDDLLKNKSKNYNKKVIKEIDGGQIINFRAFTQSSKPTPQSSYISQPQTNSPDNNWLLQQKQQDSDSRFATAPEATREGQIIDEGPSLDARSSVQASVDHFDVFTEMRQANTQKQKPPTNKGRRQKKKPARQRKYKKIPNIREEKPNPIQRENSPCFGIVDEGPCQFGEEGNFTFQEEKVNNKRKSEVNVQDLEKQVVVENVMTENFVTKNDIIVVKKKRTPKSIQIDQKLMSKGLESDVTKEETLITVQQPQKCENKYWRLVNDPPPPREKLQQDTQLNRKRVKGR